MILLGRIHLAWPVIGRWKADTFLTRAGKLDPNNPEPFYWLGQVGFALRGDDGEEISRRGLVRALAIEPRYRDAWELWTKLYRGPSERRAALAALAQHAGEPMPDLWRSQLLLESEAYRDAEPLLAALVARAPHDPAPRALLAQLLYETGRDAEAAPVYAAALALAPADTALALWRQVRSIASPAERRAWEQAAPDDRTAFFRRFWACREPNLGTPLNERVGEHFRRVRQARRLFALLHPNSLYHHSRLWRVLSGGLGPPPGPGVAEIASRVRAESPPSILDTLVAMGVGGVADEGDETPNLEDGLDDRGRVFVRYGPPDERSVWNLDGETWRYHLPAGVLQVTFARRTGGWGTTGDVVVTPFVSGERESARFLLTSDRPSLPATLRFAFWLASFRGASPAQTELLVFADSVAATAVLLDDGGREVSRDSATAGPLRLRASPGRYVVAIDAARDGRLGRYRATTPLPPYTGESLTVSSLLVTGETTPARRPDMERAAPAQLRLPADRPLRFYAEVYGLAARDGVSRYDAAYVFERLGGRGVLGLRGVPHPTSFAFQREQPVRRVTVESLVIDPGRLPPGRYRLHLEVRDAVADARAVSATLEFELR